MHEMNTDKMGAGPKIDALIARKVMGWRNAKGTWIGGVIPWATDRGLECAPPTGEFSARIEGRLIGG